MKSFLIALMLFIFYGCTPLSRLPKEVSSHIPKEANTVVMNFNMPKDSLFIFVSEFLSKENFRIFNLNKEVGFINTDGKQYSAGMLIRLNIQISQDNDQSKLLCTSEFLLPNTNDEDKYKWWKGNFSYGGYFTLCFDEMVLLLQKLPYQEVQYLRK